MTDNSESEAETGSQAAAGSNLLFARLSILLAAIMWSTSGWFAKHEAFTVWPVEDRGLLFAFWRALFAGVLILPLVRRPRWNKKLLPMLVCFALMNITYLSSIAMTTAANAIWLQNTAPVWVFLVGLFILREKAKREDIVLLMFGATGVGIILLFEMRGQAETLAQTHSRIGVLLGLASGLTYAGIAIFLRSLRSENSAWLVSVNLLVTAAVLFPFVLRLGIWPDGRQLLLLGCFGLFQMGLPYIFFSYGLRSVPTQEGSGIVLIEPILVPLWILSVEVPDWWTILGGGLILSGLLVRYVPWSGKSRAA